MLSLKIEKRTLNVVNYWDLDDFVSELFGFDEEYACVAYEEWSNDQSHEFIVSIKDFSKFDLEDIEEMKKDRQYKQYRTSTILNYACSLGLIEEGSYLIDVCW